LLTEALVEGWFAGERSPEAQTVEGAEDSG
jgi:hypothetical protein